MLILALDTTSRAGSLAIVRDTAVVHEIVGDASRTHGERLPLEFERICNDARVSLHDIDVFAVAAGPGSFTGLRVGIAAIQGLAVALGRRVVPVSTLEAVAFATDDPPEYIGTWVDAQRGEVFAQLFVHRIPRGEAFSAPPEIVLESWGREIALGNVAFHGDGAVRYSERIRAVIGPFARVADAARPLAGAIGRIAAAEPQRAVLPHAIVPIYVRRPDAELARARREGGP